MKTLRETHSDYYNDFLAYEGEGYYISHASWRVGVKYYDFTADDIIQIKGEL